MEFGIFNLMGSREADKPTAQVFGEVAEQTKLADALGYTIAWFAEHHFSNYCLCASPLMMVAHCASITRQIRLGTAVVVLPLYNPARLAAEIATADALSNGRLVLGIGAGYQPYEFERFGTDIAQNLEMTDEFCDILDLAFSRDFFSYKGKHYQMPETHIPARPVQPDRWLEEGDSVEIGDRTFEVLHCPGHTPGHIVFVNRALNFGLFGDVLFRGSVGRTDLPRGSHEDLIHSIRTRILPLGDQFTFLCGHGPGSTVGEERLTNPFLV